eukprot:10059857-Prorocentrum_lima.AAC.1
MTSSLVGSEMCIRDRFWDNMIRHCMRGPIAVVMHSPHESGIGSAAGNPCLLYTSDAADDM